MLEGCTGPLPRPQFKGGQVRSDLPPRHPWAAACVMRRKPFCSLFSRRPHAVDREFPLRRCAPQAGLSGREGRIALHAHGRCRDRRGLLHHVDGERPRVPEIRHCQKQSPRRSGTPSSPARSKRWQSCISTIRRRSGSATWRQAGNYFARCRSNAGPSSEIPRASETDVIPEMDRLIEWLPKAVPQQGSCVRWCMATIGWTT